MKEHNPSHASVVLINHRRKSIVSTNSITILVRARYASDLWVFLVRESKYFILLRFD